VHPLATAQKAHSRKKNLGKRRIHLIQEPFKKKIILYGAHTCPIALAAAAIRTLQFFYWLPF
jgi:hypothetical protein